MKIKHLFGELTACLIELSYQSVDLWMGGLIGWLGGTLLVDCFYEFMLDGTSLRKKNSNTRTCKNLPLFVTRSRQGNVANSCWSVLTSPVAGIILVSVTSSPSGGLVGVDIMPTVLSQRCTHLKEKISSSYDYCRTLMKSSFFSFR